MRSHQSTDKTDSVGELSFPPSAGRYGSGWRTMANVEPKSLLLSINHLLVLLVVIYASLSGSYLEIALFVFVFEHVCVCVAVCISRV